MLLAGVKHWFYASSGPNVFSSTTQPTIRYSYSFISSVRPLSLTHCTALRLSLIPTHLAPMMQSPPASIQLIKTPKSVGSGPTLPNRWSRPSLSYPSLCFRPGRAQPLPRQAFPSISQTLVQARPSKARSRFIGKFRMVSMSTQGPSMSLPSSSSTLQWKYDVFLNFRGDIRKNFVDHLYNALKRKGILTYRDDEKLESGKTILEELFKAIQESRIAIVIFSRDYASSTWVLNELVHIVKCKKEKGLEVVPVFYNVNPSEVRKQTGSFAEAFDKYENHSKESIEKVETWRSALREVANISGWDLQDSHESEFIQHIVKAIMKKLSLEFSSTTKNFVGIESTMAELIPSYLDFGNNVCIIGICGMGGLGKTTLARVVYDEFRGYFEGSSFISSVRAYSEKHGLPRLQQQLLADILGDKDIYISNVYDGVDMIKKRLCHKKVLLVIDDVNRLDQLEKLAGEHGWFGLGSWIIITTRDEHVLVQHGVLKIYKPKLLAKDDASKLFCLKAFKNVQPKECYMLLSKDFVKYANGLPLALVFLGSFLVGRRIDEWQCLLDSLKKIKGETFDILKISYDGLEEIWKEMFLDIACFFVGEKKDKVIQILEVCGFNARIGISVLVEKSLLTIDEEYLMMHDLLQEMGEKIVRQKSGGKLGNQSRLWLTKDLYSVLQKNMATDDIQAIVIYGNARFVPRSWQPNWHAIKARAAEGSFNFEEFSEVFSKMSNLRLLIIDGIRIHNAFNHLPDEVRYLKWDFCFLKCLPSSFQPKELVQLELRYSEFEYLWEGVKCFGKLKFIDLRDSENLIRTPDFSGVSRLERLELSGCGKLVNIHPSIGHLNRLVGLDLSYCKNLTNLPSMTAEMESFRVLKLRGCSKLANLPASISQLSKLEILDLCDCNNLQSVPELPSTVRYINAEGCTSLEPLPALLRKGRVARYGSRSYDESSGGVAFTLLNSYLQGLLCRTTGYETSTKRIEEFQIIIPATKIPRWLTHRRSGKSISIKLSPNWCNSRWMGFVLCAHFYSTGSFSWHGGVRVIALGDMPYSHYASKKFFRSTFGLPQHIWLLFLSRDDWFAAVGNGECSQIEVVFEDKFSGSIGMSKCGFSLVYKQDMEEFNQTHVITYEGWDGVHHGF